MIFPADVKLDNAIEWDRRMAEFDKRYGMGMSEARARLKEKYPDCLVLRDYNIIRNQWEYTVFVREPGRVLRIDITTNQLGETWAEVDPDDIVSQVELEYNEISQT
jgi:hypothetical protein